MGRRNCRLTQAEASWGPVWGKVLCIARGFPSTTGRHSPETRALLGRREPISERSISAPGLHMPAWFEEGALSVSYVITGPFKCTFHTNNNVQRDVSPQASVTG